jgi:choice-of-anchor B domain-containing protein
MRSWQRWLVSIATLVTGFVVPAPTVNVSASAAEETLVGFGLVVLVGDGEVFAGEPANLFRPGTVYVYRRGTTGWAEMATLVAPKAAVGDQFGSSLAMAGNRLFVGAGPSAVHVFLKTGGAWNFDQTIEAATVPEMPEAARAAVTAAAPAAGPPPGAVRFGSALSAAGDWLFIGKEPVVPLGRAGAPPPGAQTPGAAAPAVPAGAVFAFKRDGAGAYRHQSTILAGGATGAPGDNFGSAIALTEGLALVGTPGESSRAGVVHELALDVDGVWKSQRTFAPVGVQGAELFGTRLALTGDQAVVSAPGDAGGYGAAYVFRRVAQGRGRAGGAAPAAAPASAAGGNFTWIEVARLAAPAGGRADRFATSIAADDREVWIGAPGAGGPGRVFVFPGNATGFQVDGLRLVGPGWTGPGAAGTAISIRGNLAAIGAPGANRNGGGLFIYERDPFGAWREQPMLTTPLDELPAFTGSERRCNSTTGKIEMFDCGATDLMAFLPPSRLTFDGHYIEMNDIWGWTDPVTKREWALVGRRDGTSFVDITDPVRPIVAADLPLTEGARPNAWRDIKVYRDHAYIVADGAGQHGMQVFDLTRLRAIRPQGNGLPQKVAYDAIYTNIASAHNIVINEESGYAYPVGSSAGGTTCGGGLHMVDIREPKQPTFAGCFSDSGSGRAGTGYSHDAQCVTYKGPDKRYRGREICVGSNETAISLADVTDKSAPKFISRASYPNVAYTHQGWFDEQHRYFYVDDEADEGRNNINKTRTLVWDLVDLENPRLAKEHMGVEPASDHNLYVKGDVMYQANYRSGLRVLTIRDRENPREIAFFDTAPFHTNGPGFNGAWSVYPYFKSGLIVVNSIEQGLFIVRTADK